LIATVAPAAHAGMRSTSGKAAGFAAFTGDVTDSRKGFRRPRPRGAEPGTLPGPLGSTSAVSAPPQDANLMTESHVLRLEPAVRVLSNEKTVALNARGNGRTE